MTPNQLFDRLEEKFKCYFETGSVVGEDLYRQLILDDIERYSNQEKRLKEKERAEDIDDSSVAGI